jgi:hypothetical protein
MISKLIECPTRVGTSALTIGDLEKRPAMRVLLMVAIVAAWFTLALLFQFSLQVDSPKQHDQLVRRLLFDRRVNVYIKLMTIRGAHQAIFHVPRWVSGPVWPHLHCRSRDVLLDTRVRFRL